MAHCDFVVRYDPETESTYDITRKILTSIIIKRLKSKKPTICFISGDSGEGKSYSGVRLQEILLDIQGMDMKEYFEIMNVFTPLEYPQKLDKLLFDKKYKKANIICMHEAREVVRSKDWQNFLTQAISDVNAMSRQIKPMCIMIISQFIRDITTDVRYTLNFYMKVRRPKNKPARLYINVMWKDDRDLEKPRLRKRKLSGYLVDKQGRYRRFIPQYLEMSKPDKSIAELFESLDHDAKASIIRKKLDKLVQEMQTEAGLENRKVEAMVDYYMRNPDNLVAIGKRYRGKWKLSPEAREMHDLSKPEAVRFEDMIDTRMKEIGAIDSKKKEDGEG